VAKTRHIQKRMSQRAIKEEMLETVMNYGVKQGDKIVLNRKACDALLAELESLKKTVIKARERGGFVLVSDKQTLVTAYRLDSYKRTKASNDDVY